jgi:hypothetical protein
MKSYFWWWAVLLAVFVFVGWATGSAHTGADVARYFAFGVVGLGLAVGIGSGFVELRRRARGVSSDEDPPIPSPPTVRHVITTCVLLAICGSLAIRAASTPADWLALAVAIVGVLLFGGRLLAMFVRTYEDRQAS